MKEFDEMALELCAKYGIELCYANEAMQRIMFEDMSEEEAMAELKDMYGDAIYE